MAANKGGIFVQPELGFHEDHRISREMLMQIKELALHRMVSRLNSSCDALKVRRSRLN